MGQALKGTSGNACEAVAENAQNQDVTMVGKGTDGNVGDAVGLQLQLVECGVSHKLRIGRASERYSRSKVCELRLLLVLSMLVAMVPGTRFGMMPSR